MGLKEPGLRGSLRNVSVSIDAIPDNVVDNFEDAPEGVYEDGEDISDYYSGGTSDWSRTTTDAIEGELSLRSDADDRFALAVSEPENGLNRYPEAEDTVLFFIRDTNNINPNFMFNAEINAGDVSGYAAQLDTDNFIRIERFDDGSPTTLDDATIDESSTDWFWGEVDIPPTEGESEGDIEFRIYQLDEENLTRGDLIQTVSTNDSTYVGNRGVGFSRDSLSDVQGTVLDFIRIDE